MSRGKPEGAEGLMFPAAIGLPARSLPEFPFPFWNKKIEAKYFKGKGEGGTLLITITGLWIGRKSKTS